ncbi:MAG: WYL domain-containing protein [Erysipelotrichaceae bacterium]|nr:WYL domain-containing protein [Erysipelotrichaceae bacterium]
MGEKMYAVLKIFMTSNQEYLTANEIKTQLETYDIYVERKNIYAIIKQINLFFYPIFHDDFIKSIQRGGNYLSLDYFEDGELQFLLDNISYHEDLNDKDKKSLKEKLLCFSSSIQQQRLIDNDITSKKQTFSLLINLTTIMKAIEKKKVISFQYINYEILEHHLVEVLSTHGNNHELYYLSPYKIISSNNHYYVIGYNQMHQNRLSIYRIDRMRNIQTVKSAYVDTTDELDVASQMTKMINMYTSGTYDTLKIECDNRVLREIASHFGQEVYIEETHEGMYIITIEDTPISDGLIGWLMMLQDQVKVIAPLYLKEEIIKRLQLMMSQYEE